MLCCKFEVLRVIPYFFHRSKDFFFGRNVCHPYRRKVDVHFDMAVTAGFFRMNHPVLQTKGLCKTYIVNKHQNNVLKNVDLTIGEGEMGFIFQHLYMMKNLSVLDNIIFPAVKSKKNMVSRRQTEERGRALMQKLGIDNVRGNDINEVSGGQLQRACICRSMINNPKMIFADEPTGALNRASSDEVMNELLSLNRDGTAIMCVTHDSRVAAKCSRVLYIVDGGIVGEKEMGHFGGGDKEFRDRERELNNWLMEQGW